MGALGSAWLVACGAVTLHDHVEAFLVDAHFVLELCSPDCVSCLFG